LFAGSEALGPQGTHSHLHRLLPEAHDGARPVLVVDLVEHALERELAGLWW
jgi:hypothetical protein